jgi:hypothetical protein
VKQAMISTSDGASSTIKYAFSSIHYLDNHPAFPFDVSNQSLNRSTFHDTVQSYDFWPPTYDGRAIIGTAYKDHLAGLAMEENKAKLQKSKSEGDEGRTVVFA